MHQRIRIQLSHVVELLVVHGVASWIAGAFGGALLGTILASSIAVVRPYRLYVIAFAFAAFGAAAMSLYLRYSKFRPNFERLEFDFEIVEHEIVYRYMSGDAIEYRKRKKLRALRNGLRQYHDKYHWTGSPEQKDPISGVAGHIVRLTRRDTVWQLYEVDLELPLRKGQTVQTEVIWFLNDKEHVSMPFISATIEEPTDGLKFELNFAPETGVQTIACSIQAAIGGKNVLAAETQEVSSTGHVAWKPDGRPKLLHHYQVSWVFPLRSVSAKALKGSGIERLQRI
jgi:hypothetical protein